MLLQTPRLSFLGNIPSGEPGTTTTLKLMRRFVNQYKRSPEVRETALSLISELRPKDWLGEINAVFSYVRDSIRYARDVRGVETLQIPSVTMDLGAGDCDDKSTLLASLLESIGHPTRFVAIGYTKPHTYSHVYVETKHGARWMPLDATVPMALGWKPRPPVARLVIHN